MNRGKHSNARYHVVNSDASLEGFCGHSAARVFTVSSGCSCSRAIAHRMLWSLWPISVERVFGVGLFGDDGYGFAVSRLMGFLEMDWLRAKRRATCPKLGDLQIKNSKSGFVCFVWLDILNQLHNVGCIAIWKCLEWSPANAGCNTKKILGAY